MTKELKKKIDKIVREYFTSSMTFSLYRNLKALAYDVAEEATKERQEKYCEQSYEGSSLQAFDKLRKENKELQEENKQAKEIIREIFTQYPWCLPPELNQKAEAFLKEDQNEKKRKPYS